MAAYYENYPPRLPDPQSVSDLIASKGLDAALEEDFEETRKAEERLCWYHGKITREEATKLLKDAAIQHQVHSASEAVFLVRERDSGKCMSVLVENQVFHVIIVEEKQGYFFFQECDEVQGLECLITTFSGGITGHAGFHAKLTHFPIGTPPPPDSRKTGHTTLLHRGVLEGDADLVQQILDHPLFPDVNSKDSQGCSALHLAAFHGYDDVVRILLNAGAYINMADRDGLTALHRACIGSKESTVRLLIQEGHCDPDIPCVAKGWTPLHHAAKMGSVECAKTLLSLKARADLKGFQSELTPRDVAVECGRQGVLRVLDDWGNGETRHQASPDRIAVVETQPDDPTNYQTQPAEHPEGQDTESWHLQGPAITRNRAARRSKTAEDHTTPRLTMGVPHIQPARDKRHVARPEEHVRPSLQAEEVMAQPNGEIHCSQPSEEHVRPSLQVEEVMAQPNGEIHCSQPSEEHETRTHTPEVVIVKTRPFKRREVRGKNRVKMGAAFFERNCNVSTHPQDHKTQWWTKQIKPDHGIQWSAHPEEHKSPSWTMQTVTTQANHCSTDAKENLTGSRVEIVSGRDRRSRRSMKTHVAQPDYEALWTTHPEEHKTPSCTMQADTTEPNHCSADATETLSGSGVEVVIGRDRRRPRMTACDSAHEVETVFPKVEEPHPWLHSKLDQWEAEKLFRQHDLQSGLFLVRKLESGPYVLSVCTDERPEHHTIETTSHEGRVLFYLQFGPKFSSVQKLVQHFSASPKSGLHLSCYIHTDFRVVDIPGHEDLPLLTSPLRTESIKKPVPSPPPSPREDKKEEDKKEEDKKEEDTKKEDTNVEVTKEDDKKEEDRKEEDKKEEDRKEKDKKEEDRKEEDRNASGVSYTEPEPRRLSDDQDDVDEVNEDDSDDAEFSDFDDFDDYSSESGSEVAGSYDVEHPDFEDKSRGRPITRHSRVSRFISEPLYQWVAADEIMQVNGAASETKLGRSRDSCVYENVELVIGKESAIECDPADLSSGDEMAARRTSIQEVFSQTGALQRALWCEMPEVIQSGVLEQMNAKLKRGQEAMFEIITSEASYLRSLNVLENVFVMSSELSPDNNGILCKDDYDDLFSNIGTIRQISAEFLADLEARWQESYVMDDICDIIAAHAQSKFKPYVRYCGQQVLQDKTVKRLSSRADFMQAVKRLEGHRDCQSLALYSFLMLPMQRITRLPLLVNAIQHSIINPTSPQQDTAKEAFDCLQTLVTECNNEARRVQQTEYIQQLSSKMVFTEVKEFPLTSDTRYLEKEGELKRITSDASTRFLFSKDKMTHRKEPLYVFLFNDILVATKKKGEKYTVQDYCPRQSVEVQVITSKEARWLSGSSAFTFLLTLHSNHRGKKVELLLAAASESEGTRWMEALSKGLLNTQRTSDYEDWDCPQVVCVENYTAQQPDEMSLLQTDAVSVRKKMEDGWYYGERLRDGAYGWFPASCTVEIENTHVRLRNLRMQARVMEAVKKKPSPKSKS